MPEYNGSLPGALKYFIDMLKFPESFENRPACFTGLASGIWGGLRAVEHLQQIFGYRNAPIYPGRVFLPQIHNLLDETGRLKDAEMLARLKKQAEGFVEFVEKLRGVKLRGTIILKTVPPGARPTMFAAIAARHTTDAPPRVCSTRGRRLK